MLYISKGMINKSDSDVLSISRGNQTYRLNGIAAELWNRGRFGFAQTKNIQEENIINSFVKSGLAEREIENTPAAKYHMLTRCVCCPIKSFRPKFLLGALECYLITWIYKAGIRLSTAELVYLYENKILPSKELLHEKNRQALVERIYTADNIADNILEAQMGTAQNRDDVIDAIIGLLRKKYIVLL